ncbi:MAG: hypothetical protein NT080_09790 [Spirochaetes bacterium]|nr:hypothetical protein [Spirochaetota bacterium]
MLKNFTMALVASGAAFSKRYAVSASREIRRAERAAFSILAPLVARKARKGEAVRTALKYVGPGRLDVAIRGGFLSRPLRLRSGDDGFFSASFEAVRAKRDDADALRFLYLSKFDGDAANHAPAVRLRRARIALFMALSDAVLDERGGPDDEANVTVRSMMDALYYRAYESDDGTLAEPNRLRRAAAKFFYRFNTNHSALRRVYSDNLAQLTERIRSESDFLIAWAGCAIFSLNIKRQKAQDVAAFLRRAVSFEDGDPEGDRSFREAAGEVSAFMESNLSAAFASTIVADLKAAMAVSSGEAYRLYEKVLFLFERKSWEDIFRTFRRMIDSGYLAASRDYFIFYRVFAFSCFEAGYPRPGRASVAESERAATLNRFTYVSSFMNRLVVAEDAFREGRGHARYALWARLKGFAAFGLFLYAAGLVLSLAFSLVLGKRDPDLLAQTVPWLADGVENLLRVILSLDAARAGALGWTAAVAIALFCLYLAYFFARLVSAAVGRGIASLRSRNLAFFTAVNAVSFLLVFSLAVEATWWIREPFTREKLLYVTNAGSVAATRPDPFLERFIIDKGISSRYALVRAGIADLNAAVAARKGDPGALAAYLSGFDGYSKIMFAVAPNRPGIDDYRPEVFELDPFLGELVRSWRASSEARNLDLVFLYPFKYARPAGFDGMPLLDRMSVVGCVDERGPLGLAWLPDRLSLPGGKSTDAKLFFLPDETTGKQLLEQLKGLKRAQDVKVEQIRSMNVDYYYDFSPKTQEKPPAEGQDDPERNAVFAPLNVVAFPVADPARAGSCNAFIYEFSRDAAPGYAAAADASPAGRLANPGRFGALALDQRYLTMDSDLDEFLSESFFARKGRPAGDAADRAAFATVRAAFAAVVLALFALLSSTTTRQRIGMALAGAVAILPTLALLAPGHGPAFAGIALPPGFFGGWDGTIALGAMIFVALYYLAQVAGIAKNAQALAYAWAIAAVSVGTAAAGFFGVVDAAAVRDFFSGQAGIAVRLGLAALTAALSWAFFTFRLRAR